MRHHMTIVAVCPERTSRGPDQTVILHRCDCGCGRLKTTTIDGIWTKEQLSPIASQGGRST
jgi:hypothetical protein